MSTPSGTATKRPWKVDDTGAICATWENGIEVQIAITAHTHWTGDHDGGKGHAYTQRIVRETKANAALIVQAVNSLDRIGGMQGLADLERQATRYLETRNSHAALVAACQMALERLEDGEAGPQHGHRLIPTLATLRAALALAKG